MYEVDAYENPTGLFNLIIKCDLLGAVQRAIENPNEVKTWVA
jgi:hypothetical protein